MRRDIVNSLALLLVATLVLGLAYPLVVTGVAHVVAPAQAKGSLLEIAGEVRGSRLLGQDFDASDRFRGRPSAIASRAYDPAAGAASNLAADSSALVDAYAAALDRLDRLAGKTDATTLHPIEMLAASASGLDPHVSPRAARAQAPRVARATGIDVARLLDAIDRRTESRVLGLFGAPRVNVLELNLDVEAMAKERR